MSISCVTCELNICLKQSKYYHILLRAVIALNSLEWVFVFAVISSCLIRFIEMTTLDVQVIEESDSPKY